MRNSKTYDDMQLKFRIYIPINMKNLKRMQKKLQNISKLTVCLKTMDNSKTNNDIALKFGT